MGKDKETLGRIIELLWTQTQACLLRRKCKITKCSEELGAHNVSLANTWTLESITWGIQQTPETVPTDSWGIVQAAFILGACRTHMDSEWHSAEFFVCSTKVHRLYQSTFKICCHSEPLVSIGYMLCYTLLLIHRIFSVAERY